jgi:hypothetical protein
VIGIYLKKFYKTIDVYKTISVVAVFSSFCVLITTEFKIGANSVFASNNFLSSNFAENSNLIAPLMCVGIVSSIASYRKTKNSLFLCFLIPLTIVAVKLSVIQVYLILGISLFILGFSGLKRQFRTGWLAVLIFTGYAIGVLTALQGVFDRDSSIKERTDILREALKISGEFTFLPVNIDGLSDFTENFVSFYGTQFLDDFHNVFLQIMFSFGLVIGLFFLFLAISPYFENSLPFREKMEFLSVYTSLLVSLLIGVSSPNYIYIYFILLGYSVAYWLKFSEMSKFVGLKRTPITWVLIVLLFLTPAYIQAKDMRSRFNISDRVIKAKTLNMFTDQNFKALVILLSELDDAGYRNKMALNFYSIGECKYGDLVFEMMAKTNPDEVRLRGLAPVKNGCIQS